MSSPSCYSAELKFNVRLKAELRQKVQSPAFVTIAVKLSWTAGGTEHEQDGKRERNESEDVTTQLVF